MASCSSLNSSGVSGNSCKYPGGRVKGMRTRSWGERNPPPQNCADPRTLTTTPRVVKEQRKVGGVDYHVDAKVSDFPTRLGLSKVFLCAIGVVDDGEYTILLVIFLSRGQRLPTR